MPTGPKRFILLSDLVSPGRVEKRPSGVLVELVLRGSGGERGQAESDGEKVFHHKTP